MNDPLILQLVVQTGALGLCALMMVHVGRKFDRLEETINRLVGKIEVLLDRTDFRGEA